MEALLRIAEIDHVVLRCRDQARALDFYTRILGLTEERRLEALGLIQLRAGASMLDLVPATARDEEGRNIDHFCLGIEAPDMAETARYLRAQGVEVQEGPLERYGARGFGLSIYIRDSEGNVVELKQMPSADEAARAEAKAG
jgi:catechol 2,3-dioxygenase-like lactoylglutathione lyase family enzyme